VATWGEEWVTLLSFSAAALKISARALDWLELSAAVRALAPAGEQLPILRFAPWHRPNVASRILALCERRLSADWLETFGHPILLLETFVDPRRHRGALYRAANWIKVGATRGYRRRPGVYSATTDSPTTVLLPSFAGNPVPCRRQPICWPPSLEERRSTRSPRPQCSPCRSSSARSPIRAVAKAGVIRCTWCSRSPRPQRCAEHAATSTWPSGPRISPRAPVRAFAVGACPVIIGCHASQSSATRRCAPLCSTASAPQNRHAQFALKDCTRRYNDARRMSRTNSVRATRVRRSRDFAVFRPTLSWPLRCYVQHSVNPRNNGVWTLVLHASLPARNSTPVTGSVLLNPKASACLGGHSDSP